jgi:hypothetical protein
MDAHGIRVQAVVGERDGVFARLRNPRLVSTSL